MYVYVGSMFPALDIVLVKAVSSAVPPTLLLAHHLFGTVSITGRLSGYGTSSQRGKRRCGGLISVARIARGGLIVSSPRPCGHLGTALYAIPPHGLIRRTALFDWMRANPHPDHRPKRNGARATPFPTSHCFRIRAITAYPSRLYEQGPKPAYLARCGKGEGRRSAIIMQMKPNPPPPSFSLACGRNAIRCRWYCFYQNNVPLWRQQTAQTVAWAGERHDWHSVAPHPEPKSTTVSWRRRVRTPLPYILRG